ncbi:MAG: transposase, partial [Bacteroidales bacterium]|nr:transposase [Bacteroidales bacterium]
NHVHILCTLPKQLALCSYVEKIKISSNKYLKSLSRRYMDFYWQGGYGAFSVSASRTSIVKDYIENQQTHHHKKTFQEEYREFLQQYGIEYNEKFVFSD